MLLPLDLGQQKGLGHPELPKDPLKKGIIINRVRYPSHPDGLTPRNTFPLLPLPTAECTLPFTAHVVSIKKRANFSHLFNYLANVYWASTMFHVLFYPLKLQ